MTTELKPGDRVLIEAVAYEHEGRVYLRTLIEAGPYGASESPAWVVWHRDDRAELAAELERVKAQLVDAQDTRLRNLRRVGHALGCEDGADLAVIVAAAERVKAERDRLAAEVVGLMAELDGFHASQPAVEATWAEVVELRAQVAAMRPVLDLAGAWLDSIRSDTLDERARLFHDFVIAAHAYRDSQKAPAAAPASTLPDDQDADVADKANGPTGTTEGCTADRLVCTADGNTPCPRGTPDCPPECPTKAKPQPRVWHSGDPEPGPEVKAVRDCDEDLWVRQRDGWRPFEDDGEDAPERWGLLLAAYQPLTDASDEVA